MSFQWIQMRISEEKDRRTRESATLERLPSALEELGEALSGCVRSYQEEFGAESAEIQVAPAKIRVTAHAEASGQRHETSCVEVLQVPEIPGFRIDNGTGVDPLTIEVGLLPGDRIYYRDCARDQYVTLEDLTRRILDRTLFPKLPE